MSGLSLSEENLGVLKGLLKSKKSHEVILSFIGCLESACETNIVKEEYAISRADVLSASIGSRQVKKKKPKKIKVVKERVAISSAKFGEPNKYYTVVDSANANKEKLTKNATRAEKKLLYFLKSERLDFEFQRIFYYDSSYFIADFYLPKYKLVIEVDGGYHDTDAQNILDEKRTNILKQICGVKSVLRISNNETDNKKLVLELINNEINNLSYS